MSNQVDTDDWGVENDVYFAPAESNNTGGWDEEPQKNNYNSNPRGKTNNRNRNDRYEKNRHDNDSNRNDKKYSTVNNDDYVEYHHTNSYHITGANAQNGVIFLNKDDNLEKKLFQHENVGINFKDYNNISVNITGEFIPKTIKRFSDINLSPVSENVLNLLGYDTPTPIQTAAIPVGLARRDLMACAQTGSGKTAAFLIPIVEKLVKMPKFTNEYFPQEGPQHPSAIIIAPTRELAIQIYEETLKFCYRSVLRPVVIYGGAPVRFQREELHKGADIIIATPGRLIGLLDKWEIYLDEVKFLVLDEADRMLDMGFVPQIRQIVMDYDMTKCESRETTMFSATFPQSIQKLAAEFLNSNYLYVTVGRVGSTTSNITQLVVWLEEEDKFKQLMVDCESASKDHLILIFVEKKAGVDCLEVEMRKRKLMSIAIHGDKSQYEREDAMYKFKTGEFPIMVATGVASRGLDIGHVKTVINFDLPETIDEYVHKIGRTGRCGNIGTAVSYFNGNNKALTDDLIESLKETKQVIPQFLLDLSGKHSNGWGIQSAFVEAQDVRNADEEEDNWDDFN